MLICAAIVGCSQGGSGPTVAPAGNGGDNAPSVTPAPVVNSSFVAFQSHATASYEAYRTIAFNLSDDMTAANDAAIKKDGKALLAFAEAETKWLSGHPGAACYAAARAAWATAVAVVKKSGGEAAALRTASTVHDVLAANTKLSDVVGSLDDLASGACLG